MDALSTEQSNDDIVDVVPLKVLKGDQMFYQYITESNNWIGKRQILFLSKIKAFVESSQVEVRQPELRKECLKYWGIEMKSRVAPQRPDAGQLFRELVASPNQTTEFFAYKPKLLEADNLNEIQYIFGFKCIVLGAENDYNAGGANSFQSIRGFFLGTGRTNVFYWDGSASTKWTKIEAKFELSPKTLVYGEFVQELKGEGKAQRRIAAFHIIDPLFLGGTDVRDQCFEERIALANKFAKAVNKTSQTELAAVRMKRVYDLINIQHIFANMDMKECKSGAQKERLCYEMNSDGRFIIPFGLLVINTVRQPWIVKWSRSQNKLYYFNLKTGKSLFEFPADSLAHFRYTFSNRLLWKWESEQCLLNEPQTVKNKLSRLMVEEFIDKTKQA